jgi:hypothetical protein
LELHRIRRLYIRRINENLIQVEVEGVRGDLNFNQSGVKRNRSSPRPGPGVDVGVEASDTIPRAVLLGPHVLPIPPDAVSFLENATGSKSLNGICHG